MWTTSQGLCCCSVLLPAEEKEASWAEADANFSVTAGPAQQLFILLGRTTSVSGASEPQLWVLLISDVYGSGAWISGIQNPTKGPWYFTLIFLVAAKHKYYLKLNYINQQFKKLY